MRSKKKADTDSFFISDICGQSCSPIYGQDCELTKRSTNTVSKKSDFKMRRREFRAFIREQEFKRMPIPQE